MPRRPIALLLSILLSTAFASMASAYELRLEAPTPTTGLQVGDLISFDAYLDTQGEANIWVFSVSLSFESAGFAYREDLSDNTDDQLFYVPAAGKAPAYWLEAHTDKPTQWPGNSGPDQYNVDFLIQPDGALLAGSSTNTTATNVYLSTLTFEAVAPGTFLFDWGLDKGGNVFTLGGDPVQEITELVSTPGSTIATVVPEPTTALLVSMGLGALGWSRRHRSGAGGQTSP